MKAEVLARCRELIASGDRVICAVSGGADSMALLWCLYCLRETLDITLSAAHYNHHLREEASDRDAAFVEAFCRDHSIPLFQGGGDVTAHMDGCSLEEAARKLRYEFLLSLPCDKLATAHHAEDHAETVLLHLLRGSGLRGLCGIPEIRGKIIRPMLSVTKAQLLTFLRQEGILWIEDSTNETLHCRRNRLRHEVLPLLRREAPDFESNLVHRSKLLRQEDAYLDELALQIVRNAHRPPTGSNPFDETLWHCPTLLQAPPVLQRRALRLILQPHLPQNVSMDHIEKLRLLLESSDPSARLSLPDGHVAERVYSCFRIAHSTRTFVLDTELPLTGTLHVEELGIKISCKLEKNLKNFLNTPFHFAIKYDMIFETQIRIRSRRIGDQLSVRDGHTKSLKRLLIDRRLPRYQRDLLPVFTADGQVIAVAGLGAGIAYQAAPNEKSILIKIEKEEM